MRFRFAGAAERLFGSRLAVRTQPVFDLLESILRGRDDRSVSQRIALVAFAVRIFSALIAYVSQVVMARWMGDFEYGVFVVVWVGAVILGGLACLGIQTAVVRFVPEYRERLQTELLRGVLIGSRVQGLVTATFFAAIGGLGLWVFGDAISSYYLIPLYLGAITLPMLAVAEIHEGIARGFSWADLSLWPTYIVRPFLIIAFMWLAVAMGYAPTAVTAMAATIAATYLTTIGQLIALALRIRKVIGKGPRAYQPRLWLAIALPIFIVEGFFNLLTNIDIIIVGYLRAPDQVAIYFAAVKTLALVHFVSFAVRAGSAQRFSQYYAAGDHARLEAFTRDTLHWTFWPSLAMVGMLLIIGKPLLLLFGESFGEGYWLLFILSVGLVCRAAIGPAESLLIMAGQQRICAAIYTATFILNVALNFTLIPRFGLGGAATATSTALVFESIVLYYVTYARLGIRCSIFHAILPRRTVPAN
ncbi:MAG TPA: lipopolysaccharide biosynthesis protein [Bauldia sp.]|nr:lipopolysaccharide biosynthesis protein [Bauldia sp.]